MNSNISPKLSKFIQPGKAFIFSKTYCPFCDKTKDLFSTLGINFGTVEVDSKPELNNDKEFLDLLHEDSKMKTYPKIYIGRQCIGGYSEMYKLYQNQKLFKLLKSEKISFADEDEFDN